MTLLDTFLLICLAAAVIEALRYRTERGHLRIREEHLLEMEHGERKLRIAAERERDALRRRARAQASALLIMHRRLAHAEQERGHSIAEILGEAS